MKEFIQFISFVLLTPSLFAQEMIQSEEENSFYKNEKFSFNFEYAIGNFIKVYTGTETRNFSGFLLGALELEKHLNNDLSIFGELSAITDFPVFIPAPYDCFDYCENGGALGFGFGIKRTYKINEKNAIALAVGLSTNYYYWNLDIAIYDSLNVEETHERFTNWGWGINSDISYLRKIELGSDYHIFGIGVNYSPTFINSRSISNKYLHVINFKLIYKFQLREKRKGANNK